jgi:hypothetical protein
MKPKLAVCWLGKTVGYWMTPLKNPQTLPHIKGGRPANEASVRRMAWEFGWLLERLGRNRYRLWDIPSGAGGWPVPIDLSDEEGQFVTTLAGVEYFISFQEYVRSFDYPRRHEGRPDTVIDHSEVDTEIPF